MTNIRDQIGDLTEFTPGNATAVAHLESKYERQIKRLRTDLAEVYRLPTGPSTDRDKVAMIEVTVKRCAHSAGAKSQGPSDSPHTQGTK